MVISKRIIIPAAAVTVIAGAAGLYAARNVALAANSPADHQTLAQAIAGAFNLDPTQVQNVISQHNQQDYEQRLQAAVTAGKLTASQEQAILTEHNTLAAEIKAAMSQTGSTRRTALEKVRSDAQAWAKANNISAKWLLGPMRPHLRGGRSPMPSASPTAAPSS